MSHADSQKRGPFQAGHRKTTVVEVGTEDSLRAFGRRNSFFDIIYYNVYILYTLYTIYIQNYKIFFV